MEDVCCNRFELPPISDGLFSLMPTGGGGGARNPEADDGGNEVTVASDINSWTIRFQSHRKNIQIHKSVSTL